MTLASMKQPKQTHCDHSIASTTLIWRADKIVTALDYTSRSTIIAPISTQSMDVSALEPVERTFAVIE